MGMMEGPALELGYLAIFSEWGGQETVRAGLSLSLSLSVTSSPNTIQPILKHL